jgi:HEPN domain-containing protein
MSGLEEAVTLLQAAQRDLQALTGMLDREVFADEIFGFHGQQAVEKSLKAWLAALGDAYPYTHDLMSLMQRIEGLGYPVLAEFEPLLEFTLYAVQFRYGFMDTLDEPPDREGAIALVSSLYAAAVSQVGLAGD